MGRDVIVDKENESAPADAQRGGEIRRVAPLGSAPTSEPRRALLGLFSRRERWSLSGRGWLLLLGASLSLIILFLFAVHPFLAITHRVDTDVLVVEGWIHDYAIQTAVAEFRSHPYKRVFCTGGPVTGAGAYTNDYNTSASVGAERLKAAGLSDSIVQMVPSRVADRDRTYSAAIALRDWFREHDMQVPRINVLTEDVHARRSRLLSQKAFGDDVVVGVIAAPNPDYRPDRWWRYSEGVKEVITEGVAYLYARFLFHPSSALSTNHSEKLDGTGNVN